MTPTAPNQAGISIDEDMDLGFGTMLIAESDEGDYEPAGMVDTIREARELADGDLKLRMGELESGGHPMCPSRYIVWGRRYDGRYHIITTIDA